MESVMDMDIDNVSVKRTRSENEDVGLRHNKMRRNNTENSLFINYGYNEDGVATPYAEIFIQLQETNICPLCNGTLFDSCTCDFFLNDQHRNAHFELNLHIIALPKNIWKMTKRIMSYQQKVDSLSTMIVKIDELSFKGEMDEDTLEKMCLFIAELGKAIDAQIDFDVRIPLTSEKQQHMVEFFGRSAACIGIIYFDIGIMEP